MALKIINTQMTPKCRSLAILLPYTSGAFIQGFQYLHLYVETGFLHLTYQNPNFHFLSKPTLSLPSRSIAILSKNDFLFAKNFEV